MRATFIIHLAACNEISYAASQADTDGVLRAV